LHFGFDAEQIAGRDTVAALLDKQCSLPALQEAWAAGSGAPLRGLWDELAALGVQGLLAPTDVGGSGLPEVTMALVLAETGRVALPLPIMETAAVGVPLVAAVGDPAGVLPRLIDGSLLLTLVTGSGRSGGSGGSAGSAKSGGSVGSVGSVGSAGSGASAESAGSGGWVGLAPAAGLADLFLVDGPGGTMLYRRDEVDLDPVGSVDRTRDLARVRPRPGRAGAGTWLGQGPIADRAALGAAAQLIGLGSELVRTTVDYVKARHQFGVPIGSFQAVKHHLADATLQMEFAAPAVWAAAALGEGAADRARAVSMAKAMASDAATGAARAALQCHGAMGYTDDYHLHLWLKRVWCLAGAHGSAAWHRDRVGRELGI
jgi:alkylation response protein AidB-like acyl-CoA dehydrogenase